MARILCSAVAVALLANVAFGCPPSTAPGTNCPTAATCPSGQACAATPSTICTTSQFCGTSNQYTLCTLATGTNVGTAVAKYCLSAAGLACNTIQGGSNASPAATFNDFATCCGTNGVGANANYEILNVIAPTPAQTVLMCFSSGSAYQISFTGTTYGAGALCYRFPYGIDAANNKAVTTGPLPSGTAFTFANFAACCAALSPAANPAALNRGLQYGTQNPFATGLSVDKCTGAAL